MNLSRITKMSLLPLLLLSLLSAPATSWASASYTITEEELTQLESNLNRLQEINQQSQTDSETLRLQLTESQNQLTIARQQLTIARQQSAQLKAQLTALQQESRSQQSLLQTANESLAQLEREENQKRLTIKAQRNGWEAAAIILGGALLYRCK